MECLQIKQLYTRDDNDLNNNGSKYVMYQTPYSSEQDKQNKVRSCFPCVEVGNLI